MKANFPIVFNYLMESVRASAGVDASISIFGIPLCFKNGFWNALDRILGGGFSFMASTDANWEDSASAFVDCISPRLTQGHPLLNERLVFLLFVPRCGVGAPATFFALLPESPLTRRYPELLAYLGAHMVPSLG